MKKFGLIGLGVMGKNLALNLLDKNIPVSVFNRHVQGEEDDVAKVFVSENPDAEGFDDLQLFAASLERPRKILVMISAGEAVDEVIQRLLPFLDEGDVVMDGGNSHFLDTRRRSGYLSVKGILYLGVGISGGEEGARTGPSIMPGGSTEGYQLAEEYLNAIAARDKNNKPCSTYIGPDGSGHFVKMVHNGIEYAEMQILAEVYDIMHNLTGMSPEQIEGTLRDWEREGLGSFLLEITRKILVRKEDNSYLLDKVLDAAEQKGTGGWSAMAALELSAPLSTIFEAVTARIISAHKSDRVEAADAYTLKPRLVKPGLLSMDQVKNAYQAARIINHITGFNLLHEASDQNNWNLNLSEIARIWTSGCIIRSELMEALSEYLKTKNKLLQHTAIVNELQKLYSGLSSVIAASLNNHIALPVLSGAANYFLACIRADSPANLIQAQRDYFGAHTYRRRDKMESEYFHSNWK